MKLPGGKTLASAWTPCVNANASYIRVDTGRPRGRSPAPPSPTDTVYCPRRPERSKKIKFKNYFFIFLGSCSRLAKRQKKISVFSFQSPRSPSSAGEAARRRRFFRPSSPSHPSKLYSSLGLLNSKVPKPASPFSLRLIDVDGF
jgi:hypothetical protein